MPGESILANRDPLDFMDVIFKIEASFNIRFADDEFKDVTTFGELCAIILNKLQMAEASDCTNQQAFHKLRDACCATMGLSPFRILPSNHLVDIFPRTSRRKDLDLVGTKLGIPLNILRPKQWLLALCALTTLISFIFLFAVPKFGAPALIISFIGWYGCLKLGREFSVETLADLVKKITRENYLKSRRNPATVNKKEVVEQLRNLFAFELDIDREMLSPDAKF